MVNDGAKVCWLADGPIKIYKWKVREGAQVQRNHIILLYKEYRADDTKAVATDPPAALDEIKRFKTQQSGVVKRCLFKDGDIVNKGYVYQFIFLAPFTHEHNLFFV